jgi:2,4-dienoyl-CoA reductase-like NADH-dependent reductase (Old Yellow Enzyme family)
MTQSRAEAEAGSLLFSPFQVGAVRLRNRIVMPPMKSNMDLAGPLARAYYGERAAGGVGLVIVEATPLDQFQDPRLVEGLAALAQVIHEGEAAAAIQVFHPGVIGGEHVAPSATGTAREATAEEVALIPALFADAAAKAQEAGFEGAEIHGAHGFFLNQFFSPRHNRRSDGWGGSLEGRMRLGVASARALRRKCRPDFLVLYRHTAASDYPLADSLVFAPQLARAGVDIVDISPSTSGEGEEHADLAAAVKAEVSCPVIAVGGMEDAEAAEAVLGQEKADLVAIGRPLIADADLPRKLQEGRGDEIVRCIKCDEKCFGNLRKGVPIGCTQNPRAGLEYQSA